MQLYPQVEGIAATKDEDRDFYTSPHSHIGLMKPGHDLDLNKPLLPGLLAKINAIPSEAEMVLVCDCPT